MVQCRHYNVQVKTWLIIIAVTDLVLSSNGIWTHHEYGSSKVTSQHTHSKHVQQEASHYEIPRHSERSKFAQMKHGRKIMPAMALSIHVYIFQAKRRTSARPHNVIIERVST